ncbi:MAG: hypothetical protein DHS20C01_36360 [marine bacterium B5-7]|nr:MAG: hypothetical protein DHS20C01_36360 [marine bacterium B5-7]
MTNEPVEANKKITSSGLRWPQVVMIVLATIAITIGLTYWVLSQYVFLKEFKPTILKPAEEQVLNQKLKAIGVTISDEPTSSKTNTLEPEAYSEVGANREVAFNEREINAMLAKNTDLARKMAVDLSDDLVSVKILVPLDPDFPILGGKTLRVNAGVEFAYKESRPVIVLKGVSVMGVPIPNAWLGNLKNVDLAREFGGDAGFWKSFSEGVDYIQVTEGRLLVKLKE